MVRRLATGCLAVSASICVLLASSTIFSSNVSAQSKIIIINANGPNEGLNDPTPVNPAPGNPATTRGQQRLNVLIAAANHWSGIISTNVEIQIRATFEPLPCTTDTATLGSAGPTSALRDFQGAPVANTYYPIALANSLAGEDLNQQTAEINARFNSRLDDDPNCLTRSDWWYGIGFPAPSNRIELFNTVRHEIGHGLGFLTFVTLGTGQKLNNRDDAYMRLLEDHSTGENWSTMNNIERATSAVNEPSLHWEGSSVIECSSKLLTIGATSDGHVQMYAPATLRLGSSVSHWDTALVPDELMEPFARPATSQELTNRLLRDMGWNISVSEC